LDTADTGNDLVVEIETSLRANSVQDAKDAVIEAWITPSEEGAALLLA
jgi:hypothetical protein